METELHLHSITSDSERHSVVSVIRAVEILVCVQAIDSLLPTDCEANFGVNSVEA